MKNLDPIRSKSGTSPAASTSTARRLKKVAANSRKIVEAFNGTKRLPLKIVFKPVLTTPDAIGRTLPRSQSRSQMRGPDPVDAHVLAVEDVDRRPLALQKPFLHLHTQFNRDLPWGEIDMDFMNLNQSAHGDREAGFLHTRMRLSRKVVVGHWADTKLAGPLAAWMRAARAWHDWQGAKFCRFGDNMRQVAVTEGDKVSAKRNLAMQSMATVSATL